MLTELESRRRALLAGLRALVAAREALNRLETELAIAARLAGCTWTELAAELGLSRQGVRKRYRADTLERRRTVDPEPFFQRGSWT